METRKCSGSFVTSVLALHVGEAMRLMSVLFTAETRQLLEVSQTVVGLHTEYCCSVRIIGTPCHIPYKICVCLS